MPLAALVIVAPLRMHKGLVLLVDVENRMRAMLGYLQIQCYCEWRDSEHPVTLTRAPSAASSRSFDVVLLAPIRVNDAAVLCHKL
jgi:hypothetical protein